MTPEQKKIFIRLVKKVPDKLKAETASKLKYALEKGWTKIYFWEPKEAHPADLFGVNPDGKIDVVPNSRKRELYDD